MVLLARRTTTRHCIYMLRSLLVLCMQSTSTVCIALPGNAVYSTSSTSSKPCLYTLCVH